MCSIIIESNSLQALVLGLTLLSHEGLHLFYIKERQKMSVKVLYRTKHFPKNNPMYTAPIRSFSLFDIRGLLYILL